MNDLDKIMLNQVLIMRGLAMVLIPGDLRAAADTRRETANELLEISDETRKYYQRREAAKHGQQ